MSPYRAVEMPEQWTEKYRPKSLSDVVGNEAAARTMKRWAESWSRGVPRVKALILRGEPGTGKTSSALALARDFDWDVVEMNASDHRNADSIRRIAGLGAISQTFTSAGEFLSTTKGKRKLIIIDEADNMFGREDFGGAKAIVETVKESSQPVIMIVNDYYELTRKASALKSLADSVTFKRLDKRTIVTVLMNIARAEGVSIAQGP
ncbi:MAG TPA: AAA family ATPase, partial [Thermoplasmata archaeon]|nr:AAA family ATPase [Thermoplasmata archaeon]